MIELSIEFPFFFLPWNKTPLFLSRPSSTSGMHNCTHVGMRSRSRICCAHTLHVRIMYGHNVSVHISTWTDADNSIRHVKRFDRPSLYVVRIQCCILPTGSLNEFVVIDEWRWIGVAWKRIVELHNRDSLPVWCSNFYNSFQRSTHGRESILNYYYYFLILRNYEMPRDMRHTRTRTRAQTQQCGHSIKSTHSRI